MMVSKSGISFSRDFFSGSMLNLQGCRPLDVTRSRCAIASENGRDSDMNKSFGDGM